MRTFLIVAVALLLAWQARNARADTMYKCVDAKGRIAYSDLPCPGQARAAREFAVPPPETAEESAVRLAAQSVSLRRAEAQFKRRHEQRTREQNARLQRGNQMSARAPAGAPGEGRLDGPRKAGAGGSPSSSGPSTAPIKK